MKQSIRSKNSKKALSVTFTNLSTGDDGLICHSNSLSLLSETFLLNIEFTVRVFVIPFMPIDIFFNLFLHDSITQLIISTVSYKSLYKFNYTSFYFISFKYLIRLNARFTCVCTWKIFRLSCLLAFSGPAFNWDTTTGF